MSQIRASDDYATGDKLGDHDPFNANLYVGASSLFAAALGLAPSKDVFWSNATQRYPAAPAAGHSPRYKTAHEPFPEMQTAVALLTAGPVGPGDQIGAANKSLLLSTCRSDGLLLKPGYPAIVHDSILVSTQTLPLCLLELDVDRVLVVAGGPCQRWPRWGPDRVGRAERRL